MKPTYHPKPKKRKANNSALAYWSKPQNSLTKLKQRKKLIKENQPRETNIGHQQPQTTH